MFKLYLYGIEMAIKTTIAIFLACSNCTFMELKCRRRKPNLGSMEVQIVPLWNWNMETHWIGGAIIQFKLYLYGIEIMGLKNVKCRTEVQIVPLWNWNEFLSLQEIRDDTVQIVPLWNWNEGNLFQEDQQPPFKLYLYGIEMKVYEWWDKQVSVQIVPLWNWNRAIQWISRRIVCSNCTLWNWNVCVLEIEEISCLFKLYLYGIEISVFTLFTIVIMRSNCTFMELKLIVSFLMFKRKDGSNCTFMELK